MDFPHFKDGVLHNIKFSDSFNGSLIISDHHCFEICIILLLGLEMHLLAEVGL